MTTGNAYADLLLGVLVTLGGAFVLVFLGMILSEVLDFLYEKLMSRIRRIFY